MAHAKGVLSNGGGDAMPMRRTIGISLAFMMFSCGATAKMLEGSTRSDPLEPAGVKPAKAGSRTARPPGLACEAARARATGSATARHGWQARHRYAGSQSDEPPGSGPPDAYLGPVQPIGRGEVGKAAWYNMVGAPTSSGELLDTVSATAAHRSLPLASYARVTSLDNGRSVVVKINDRGPFTRRFIIDLSPRAADELGVRRTGVAAVVVEPVATGPAAALTQRP
jgi:rare lipoprotein A